MLNEAIIDKTAFSYSDIAGWLRCPRSIYLKLAGTPESDSGACAWGRVVHRLHEYILAEGVGPGDVVHAIEVLDDLAAQETTDPTMDVDIRKRVEKTKTEGIPWLLRQMAGREQLAAEAALNAEIPGLPGIQLTGHPDAIYYQGDTLYLGDIKSGQPKPRDVRTDLQLNLYAWLVGASAGVSPDRIEITHLWSCTVFKADLDQKIQEALIGTVVRPAVAAMLEGNWPANPSHPFSCGYCNYSSGCAWRLER